MLPIERPSKIICVGLNYSDHAEEQGAELPAEPLLFAKWPSSLIGPGESIVIPPIVTKADYEAELGVVIGSRVKGVSKENAFEAVRGYLCANDVSARDLQFSDGQWTRGKSPDTFCPVGPMTPRDEITDPHTLAIRSLVIPADGEVTIEANESPTELLVTVDGQVGTSFVKGEQLKVRRADNPVRIVRFPGATFFERMRVKLGWGGLPDEQGSA